MRKDNYKPYILKEEEDIDDLNKKLKVPIIKIDIKENIYPSNNNIDLQNPEFDYNLKDKEKENKIPNIINIHKEIDLIDIIIQQKRKKKRKMKLEKKMKKRILKRKMKLKRKLKKKNKIN